RLPQLVEPLEDRDRLAAQLAVDPPPVVLRQLPRAAVELGLADLAVLRLLGGLELLAELLLGALLPLGAAQRAGDEKRHDREQDDDGEPVLHRHARANSRSSRPTRAAYTPPSGRRPAGHSAITAPSTATRPPIQIHATIGE